MSIHYRQQGSAIIVFGNTYPFRDQIKLLGGRFNGPEKTWRIPLSDGNLKSVNDLCVGAGGGCLGEVAVTAKVSEFLSAAPDVLSAAKDLGEFLPGPSLRSGRQELRSGTQDDSSLTIRQLMERAGQALTSAFPDTIWVVGEVQNIATKGSGTFFDLAEATAGGHANSTMTVRAIIWQGSLGQIKARRGEERLAEVLQDGMQIRCLCQVQLYRDRGSITLVIEDIDPAYTKGALALAREKLLRELRAKGLDQAQKRLPMPPFPLRIGLISAAGSRAYSDFVDQLYSLGYPGSVVFVPTPMQGERVPQLVVSAIKRLALAGVDLIVMTRGGGSAADLRWFDASEIAYAIATCGVPVIAAIGHHEDVCVAEEICHARQKTPTAAADFVATVLVATRQRIDGLATVLAKRLDQRTEEFTLLAATLGERLAHAANRSLSERANTLLQRGHALQRGAANLLHAGSTKLATLAQTLSVAAERSLTSRATDLLKLEGELKQRDPKPWLAQGWTQLSGKSGPVRRIGATQIGDQIKARLLDGWLDLTVTGKTTTEKSEKEAP